MHEREAEVWAKYGIGAQRVDTIHEAVTKLKNGERFFFVVINEDCIPDFLPQLPILKGVCAFPVIVVTSSYTPEKKLTAMQNGADLYVPFNKKAEHDVLITLEVFSVNNNWANHYKIKLPILTHGDIIMNIVTRQVFLKDTEIKLTKKEFDVLYYLVKKHGQIVTHSEMLKEVWGLDSIATEHIWRVTSRLRKKLANVSDNEYIQIEHGIGYKFMS